MSIPQQITENLAETLQNNLLDCWMRHKQPEIKQEVKKRVEEEQKRIDESVKARAKREQERKIKHKEFVAKQKVDSSKKELDRINNDWSPYNTPEQEIDTRIDEAGIERAVKGEFKSTFYKEEWNRKRYKDILENQINKNIDPSKLHERLFNRHPWFADDQLAYQYLLNFIKNDLYDLLPSPYKQNPEYWSWSTGLPKDFEGSWAKQDAQQVENFIEGCPFFNIFGAYNESRQFPRLGKKSSFDPETYRLTRADVFHYTINRFKTKTDSKLVDGIFTPKLAPFHHQEFQYVNENRLNHLEGMIVNLGEEYSPSWIYFHKKNGEWIAYCPENLDSTEKKNLNNLEKYFKFKEQVVDFKTNDRPSSMVGLTSSAKWHAVLFSKVIPWCQKQGGITLDDYQKEVPVSLMVEDVLKSVVLDTEHVVTPKLNKALANRDPFSSQRASELYSYYGYYYYWSYSKKPDCLLDNDSIKNYNSDLLKLFESKTLTLADDTLSLKSENNVQELLKALYVLYHHRDITRFHIPKVLGSYSKSDIDRLFTFNTTLLSVLPSSSDTIKDNNSYTPVAMTAAARNRFLKSTLQPKEWDTLYQFDKTKDVWKTTGEQLTKFFQTSGQQLDLDLIYIALKLNKAWGKANWDHSYESSVTPQALWQWMQVALMGTKGLDALFEHVNRAHIESWDPLYKENPPALSAVFDLHGSPNETPEKYASHLLTNIKRYGENRKNCPIFQSLALVMPEDKTANVNQQIADIFEAINRQKMTKKDEVAEISLFNLDIKSEPASELLCKLEELANNQNLQILVRIPAWDREAFQEKQDCEQKAKYRAIQNKILDNQRVAKLDALNKDTRNIHLCAENKLKPEAILKEKRADEIIPWEGDDVQFPLTTQGVGIQQQFQQEMQQQQQQQQEQEQEQEEEQEQEQEVMQYSGDEGLLITRETIDSDKTCGEHWSAIPESVKSYSGVKGNSLKSLFSLWVGSEVDAELVIKKMEPAAAKKLMEHASVFRLGLNKDNLPPGFKLALSRQDKGLVLCYNDRLEKEQILKYNQQPLDERNPFTLVMHKPMDAEVFRGDYRQFVPLSKQKDTDWQLLWKFLATERQDVAEQKSHEQLLNSLGVKASTENYSVVTQDYTIRGSKDNLTLNPGDHETCRALIKDLAVKTSGDLPVIQVLFDEKSGLDEAQLKAFGQLFYRHDAANPGTKNNGTKEFLFLANQIYTTFGKDHFKVWMDSILKHSKNFSECLAKDEVDAVALCIVKLKNNTNKSHENIWWALVKAHARSVGPMQYAPLWHSYEKIIDFLNKKQRPNLDEASILRYLEKADNFNGQVFLDRLFDVLKRSEKMLDKAKIQKDIVENIDKIDWRHNGYYYAARYHKHPFWHESLGLSEFKSPLDPKSPGYIPGMDSWDKLTTDALYHQGLRFVSQRTAPALSDFKTFEVIMRDSIKPHLNDKNAPLVMRLLVACVTQGVDNLADLDQKTIKDQIATLLKSDTQMLKWLNEPLEIDGEMKPGSLHLKFGHIQDAISAMQKFKLDSIKPNSRMSFVNACGRALQCFNSNVRDLEITPARALELLLEKTGNNADHPVITIAPWLFNEDKVSLENLEKEFKAITGYNRIKELQIFERQLQTIDFTQSIHLPSLDDINKFIEEFKSSQDPEQVRKTYVKQLINKGCTIVYQDASYRPITPEEQIEANHINKLLIANFRDDNIALCKKFFEQYVAVEVQGKGQTKDIKALIVKLKQIDNKGYYNELGGVLGLLAEKAKGKRYSITQLTSWLDVLINPATIDQEHFPADLLKIILEKETNNPQSSLVNKDLDALGRSIDRAIEKLAREFVRSKLPAQYKPALLKWLMYHPSQQLFVTEFKNKLEALSDNKSSPKRLKALQKYIETLSLQNDTHSMWNLCTDVQGFRSQMLDTHTDVGLSKPITLKLPDESASIVSPGELRQTWDSCHTFLTELLTRELNEPDSELAKDKQITSPLHFAKNTDSSLVKLIVLQVLEQELAKRSSRKLTAKDISDIQILTQTLQKLSTAERAHLVHYFGTLPVPSFSTLNDLLTNNTIKRDDNFISHLIHKFETHYQGLDAKGDPIRHYSITDKDSKGLTRILSHLKRKGHSNNAGILKDAEKKELVNTLYYLNSFSQVANLDKIPFSELQSELHKARGELQEHPKDGMAIARMLACMREVMIRKTGMWPNHTQMLVLLYAAKHNDESLLLQVKTGQGKSIITSMRASWLALNGYVVDVFSSKDSLSERDHMEFKHVYDAMGIPNSYVTPHSSRETYKTSTKNNIGAINFATIGNLSLFFDNQVWKKGNTVPVDKNDKNQKRAAFLDECDHVLTDEDTQFNYSDTGGVDVAYNYDEWVYRTTYEFYLNRKDTFETNKQNIKLISRNKDFKALVELLKEKSKGSPRESTFFEKYISPALDKKPGANKKLETVLKQLVVAAHSAHNLKKGVHYSIVQEQRTVAGGAVLDTRFSKVLISNQIKLGSTYSEGVHQLLHARLNKEAIDKGEAPNFFIEPDTRITISRNTKYMLQNYYHKIEGGTGTVGDLDDVRSYEKGYNINHVIKVPSHEESATNFLPTEYCDNEDAQVKSIVDKLEHYTDRPILITCEDDIAVNRLHEKILAELNKRKNTSIEKNIIKDTNDSGKSENEVVPEAGGMGKVTISSRMGRGTDIKPKTDEGLMVIRTYPDIIRKVKQELGRQGRNGKKGTAVDLFDYSQINKDYEKYLKSEAYSTRLKQLTGKHKTNLQDKIKDNADNDRFKYKAFANNDELQEKYAKSRALQQLKYEIKKKNQIFIRKKEALINDLSGAVFKFLNRDPKDIGLTLKQIDTFKREWNDARDALEAVWSNRLAGQTQDTVEIYNQFVDEVAIDWQWLSDKYRLEQSLCENNKLTDKEAIVRVDSDELLEEKPLKLKTENVDQSELKTEISFYQKWVAGADKHYFGSKPISSELKTAIYGANKVSAPLWRSEEEDTGYGGLKSLYKSLHSAGTKNNQEKQEKLFGALSKLPEPSLFLVSTKGLAETVKLLTSKFTDKNFEGYLECLHSFFDSKVLKDKIPSESKPEDIKKYDLLLDVVMSITTTCYVKEIGPERSTANLVQNLCNVICNDYWDDFDANFAEQIKTVYATDIDVTELLSAKALNQDLHEFLRLIKLSMQDKSNKRINDLHKYLRDHKKELLTEQLETVKPIVQAVLAGAGKSKEDYYLPEQVRFKHLTKEEDGDLWHFISQRHPVNEADIVWIQSLLDTHHEQKSYKDYLFRPLIALPPYIPISYIKTQLKGLDSYSNRGELKQAFEQIRKSGNVFNKFALNHQLIGSDQRYQQEKVQPAYEQLLQLFATMTPAKNEEFFQRCSDKALPLEAVYILAQAWSSNKLADHNDLLAILNITDKIKSKGIAEGEINTIFKHWQKEDYQLDALMPSLNMLKDAAEFQKLYPDIHVMAVYDKEPTQDAKTAKQYRDFFAAVNAKGYENDTMNALFNACFKEKIIKNNADLKDAIKGIDEAIELKKNKNWNDYFGSPQCSKHKERKSIMQLVVASILNLGQEFTDRCFKEFGRLAQKVLTVPELGGLSADGRRKALSSSYRQLVDFSNELGAVSSYNSTPVAVKNHAAFFMEKQKEYKGVWWKNRQRQEQAAQLFRTLSVHTNQQDSDTIDTTYCQNVLNVIWDTQKDILASDKDTRQNTKGYSRLYDITVQMTLKVCKDYIENTEISRADKGWLNTHVKEQLTYQIQLLSERLPAKYNDLKELLASYDPDEMHPGSVELAEFTDKIKAVKWSALPYNLTYLVTNINGFIDLQNEDAEGKYSQQRGLK